MSEKPHSVAIGAFVIGALLIAVTIVIFALGSGFGQQREKVVMVFDGSVKGLVVGAPVALRGVQVGQVTNLELMLDNGSNDLIMLVEAEIIGKNVKRLGTDLEELTDKLIAQGLRAQLKTQSLLTGLLYIQLDFHPGKPAVFVKLNSDKLQIPTVPTELEVLTRKIDEIDLARIADKLQSTLDGINAFVTNAALQKLPSDLQTSLVSVTGLSEELRGRVATLGPKLDRVLESADETLAGANTEIPKLSSLVQQNLELLSNAIAAFDGAMQNVDGLIAPDSATTYELNSALRELSLASRAIQRLADTLDEQPEALLRGKREEGQ